MDVALTPVRENAAGGALIRVRAAIASAWLGSRSISPSLGSVTLAPHQQDAAQRLLDLIDAAGGALLADATGMGKTYTALGVARAFPCCAIVAPAALREMWRQALAVAGMQAPFVSVESLSRGHAGIAATIVVVDEAHHVRNPATRRYDALARLTVGARVLLLTATPLHNRPAELRALLALFLGARAFTLGIEELVPLIVRRRHGALSSSPMPAVGRPIALRIAPAPDVLRAIAALPAALPPADGGAADALLRLGLVRAWTSSDAAVRCALRRRLYRAEALTQALANGRLPTRSELTAWSALDDAVQLAFPELMASPTDETDAPHLSAVLTEHVDGIRRVLAAMNAAPENDLRRATLLRTIRKRHAGERIVAFACFAETARAMYALLRNDGGIGLVTATGARIASGSVSRQDIIQRFGVVDPADRHFPLDVLIATDVLSEGLNLQGASVLVHLDLPWTVARLEQRLGRLRRIGSRHDRVVVYFVAPPARRRELSGVVRALRRKARVIWLVLGGEESTEHLPDVLHGRGVLPRNGDDLAAMNEELRAILQSWIATPTDPSGYSGDEPRSTVVRGVGIEAPWEAIALMSVRGRPRLIAIEAERATSSTAAVLRVARHLSVAGANADSLGVDQRSAPALRAAEARAAGWLADRRGENLSAAALDAPSAAHARALRQVSRLAASLPRHRRTALGNLVTTVRADILVARGAGSERILTDWLALEATPVANDVEARLTALSKLLRPRALPDTRIADLEVDRLVALLVMVPR